MLEAPEDLTAEHICATLRTWWGIDPVDVDYAAVGHGSHNWIVVAVDETKWFVKADRQGEDTSEFFRSTYETAAVLRDGGLDFVHAATTRVRSGAVPGGVASQRDIGLPPGVQHPHGESENAANDWHHLNRYLPITRNWPEIRVRT